MPVNIPSRVNHGAKDEISLLKKQLRQLQVCMIAVVAIGAIAATSGAPEALRARKIAVVDAKGRDRIVIEASGSNGAPHIDVRSDTGAERVFIGEEPDPVVAGKRYPRIAPAWGMLLFNPQGSERGGYSYVDNGRSILSLDRPNAEGVYLTVNEKSGFAGLVGNYETGRVGDYAEAFRVGTLGEKVFAQATNRNGSPAGALVGGTSGNLRKGEVVEK